MSGEYISREAAIKEVYRFDDYLDDDLEWRLHYALKRLPAADVVEVRHGRWEHLNWGFDYDRCTECGYEHRYSDAFNYCPSCGAKMDGGQDDV